MGGVSGPLDTAGEVFVESLKRCVPARLHDHLMDLPVQGEVGRIVVSFQAATMAWCLVSIAATS